MMRSGALPWVSTIATNIAVTVLTALLIWTVGIIPFLLIHLPIVLIAGSAGVWLLIPILGELQQWVKGFVMENSTNTLSLLKDLSAGVSNGIAHNARDTGETQPPLETISLRCGSCQDLATLFAESVRVLASGRGSCPDISTTRRTPSSVRRREARPMHGLKFSFRVRDGSPSTRQIGAWAALT